MSSSDEDFEKRRKSVFAFDEVTIKAGKSAVEDDKGEKDDLISEKYVKKSSTADEFKGRESLFRVPDNEWRKPDKFAAFRNRPHHQRGGGQRRPERVPDFKKNPDKYTKYSLKDVDVLNNKSNSAAAFDFLRQMDDRKRKAETEMDEEEISDRKIVFKKPKKDEETATSSTSKDEDEKAPKKKKKKASKKSQMTLSHLIDEDE